MKVFAEKEINGNRSKRVLWTLAGGVILLCFCLVVSLSKGLSFHKIGVKLSLVCDKPCDAPDYWCMRGWTSSLQKMRFTADICFFGHSQIEASDFQSSFPDKKIVELGYPGDNIKGMERRVDQIKAVHPKKVFVLAGTNSLGYTKSEFEQEYKNLLNSIRDSVPSAKIYVFAIIPQRDGILGQSKRNEIIRERNSFISAFCKANHLPLIDTYKLFVDKRGDLAQVFSKDGVHINGKAYKVWAKLLKPYIEE